MSSDPAFVRGSRSCLSGPLPRSARSLSSFRRARVARLLWRRHRTRQAEPTLTTAPPRQELHGGVDRTECPAGASSSRCAQRGPPALGQSTAKAHTPAQPRGVMMRTDPSSDPDRHIVIGSSKRGRLVTSEAGFPWDAPAPTEHGKHAIEIELSYPVNPWEHEGAGAITWGAGLDRLAPLGEEAVSIIKEAWEQEREHPRDRTNREQKESDRRPWPYRRRGDQAGLGEPSRVRAVLDPRDAVCTRQRTLGRGGGQELVTGPAHQRRDRQAKRDRRSDHAPRSEGAADHRGAAQRSSVRRYRAAGARCLV